VKVTIKKSKVFWLIYKIRYGFWFWSLYQPIVAFCIIIGLLLKFEHYAIISKQLLYFILSAIHFTLAQS
jgi:hypothetical protein